MASYLCTFTQLEVWSEKVREVSTKGEVYVNYRLDSIPKWMDIRQ